MTDPFRFEYEPAVLRYGAGAVADLDQELDEHGFKRALVVCGETVGSTPAVIDPVRFGLGDRLVGIFDETTPEKRLSTAYDALEAYREHDADVLVGVGGGSSLDVAKVASLLAASTRDPSLVGSELADKGTISVPREGLAPVVAVPTTLAGADLSIGAGVTESPDSGLVATKASGGVSAPQLMPKAVVADPELVATTPKRILTASAMNGFDKGIETLYAANATPVTDATARRGLELLGDGLLELGAGSADAGTLAPVVKGLLLVQYGIWQPDGTTMSLIHAFGHGLTRSYEVQQGAAHGIIAPHALRFLFERVDGRRDMLADALGVGAEPDPADAVVRQVTAVRDALGLPAQLRDVPGPEPEAFESVAAAVTRDSFMDNAPEGLSPTVAELQAVLEAAY